MGQHHPYSKDMSANADAIRIAYVAGDSANGLDAGYYIWLGMFSSGKRRRQRGKFFRPHVQLFRHAGRHPVQSGFGRFPFLRPSTTGITGPEPLYLANGASPSTLNRA